jgi:UDP-2,3-diacylglucosamine hydrolase
LIIKQIPVTAPALFISDLHLDASRPDITAQFLEFLRGEARQARALYILGDLFEAWIGDDDPDSDKQRVQSALRDLTQAGVPCYVMHGNRDFLLGNRFLTNTGCQLLRDPQTIDLNGQRVLVLHGDLLCTDDRAYQRLRRRVRNPFLQFILRHLPLRTRQSLAAKMRAGSKAHIAAAMESIMDVNADAVARAFDAHDVRLMIHGHTHRPAVHRVQTPRGDATRIVLGDWYTQGSVLRFDDKGFELRTLTRPAH